MVWSGWNFYPVKVSREIVDLLFEEFVGCSEEEFSKQLYMNMEQIQEMKAAGMFFGLHENGVETKI